MATVLQAPQEQQGPRVIPIMAPEQLRTPRQVDRDASLYSTTTDVPTEQVRQQVAAGVTAGLETQADQQATAQSQDILQTSLDGGEDMNAVVTGMIEEARQIEFFRRHLPASMTAAIRNNVPGASEFVLDRLTRLSTTAERIAERTDQMGSSYTGIGLNLAEVLLDPLSLYHSATYRRLTREYESLLLPSVPIEEFEAGLDHILTEAADAGFLSNENLFFFGDFLDTLGSGVYSGHQQVQEILGVIDIVGTAATEGVSLAGRGPRAIRALRSLASTTSLSTGIIARGLGGAVRDASRDVLSTIGLMRPNTRVNTATREIVDHLVTIDDPRRSASDISAHSHVSAGTPTLSRGGFLSSPVHDAVRAFEERSTELNLVMDAIHRTGSVFDESTFQSFATHLRADRLRLLTDSGARRIIDVEVGTDEFSNIFVLDVTGTTRGQYFTSQNAARRAAAYGDEVVEVAPSQFAVVRRHNVSADNFNQLRELGYSGDIRGAMLYRATDPEQLGDGFWARFGSPQAQADPEMVSYLHRTASVQQDLLHQIRTRTNQITRGMPTRQVVEVYGAFDAMAASARRDAFTQQEFGSWFFNTYQREPTAQQTSLYLLQQERLDAELFLTADSLYRGAVDAGMEALRSNGIEYIVRRVSRDSLPANARVFDESAGRVVSVGGVGERQVYVNTGVTDFPDNVQYFVSNTPETRAVRHSDFIARNAGGHRAYVVNEMQYLLKQRNVRVYSDGTTREISPRTLLGTRTPEEARRAMEEINNIIDAVEGELRGTSGGRRAVMASTDYERLSNAEFSNLLTSLRNNRVVREAVEANTGWNPHISNLDDLVEFASERGLDLRRRFEVVAEGEPLRVFPSSPDAMNDFAFALREGTHADDVRLNALRGGRGSIPLSGYGGKPISTRPTQDVLEGSYISSTARATETAYRLRNFNGIIKAAVESGVMKGDYAAISRLPIRTQIERILRDNLIDTTGAKGANANIGPRLRLDLQRLQFRLQQRSFTTRIFQNAYRRTANYLYGKGAAGQWAAGKFDRFSRDPLSAIRGFAFDNYLGMFNTSQFLMQSSQIINIVGVAGVNGAKAAAVYLPFRFILSNGHDEVLERVARLTRGTTGLDADDWRTMIAMFKESGRNIVDNNLAELTVAEDAMSNFGRFGINRAVRKTREAGRLPYKEGDLAARITAFTTAFMEYTTKNGKITRVRDPRAINYITNREQVLTQSMTGESRQAYEQLPFMQFMTYNLRIAEAMLAGTFSNTRSVLTGAEKVRLASTHFAMWGAMASAPTALLSQYILSNYDVHVNEHLLRGVTSGALDAIVSWISGSDTQIAARFAAGTGWSEMIRAYAEEGLLANLIGPSGELAFNAGSVGLSTIYHAMNGIVTGDFTSSQDDLISLARFTSSGNYTYNAYTAFRYGEYLSRRGSFTAEGLSGMDSVFLLFGIPLEEVNSLYQYQADRRFRTRWLEATVVPRLNSLYENMWTAARRDDIERVSTYYRQIAMTEGQLDPWERNIVDARVNPDWRSAQNSLLLELMQREVTMRERVQ